MRTTHATPASPTTSARAATVRVSALATAFLTGTAAISLLVAPAAGAAAFQGSVATGAQGSVATTWGHDDRRDNHSWNGWSKPGQTSDETKTVAWLMPKSTGAWVSWPQDLAPGGNLPDCGTGWYQVDVYRYATADEKKFVDDFMRDNKLEGPSEDGSVYISHQFLQPTNDPAKCTPTTPTPPVTPPVTEVPPVTPPVVEVPPVEVPTAEVPVVEVPVVEPPATEVPDAEVPAVEEPTVVPPVQEGPAEAEAPVVVPAPTVTTPISGVGGVSGIAPAPTVVPPASTTTATQPRAVVTEGSQLAVTGAKVGLLSALAAVLVAAGVVAFRISRRPRATK